VALPPGFRPGKASIRGLRPLKLNVFFYNKWLSFVMKIQRISSFRVKCQVHKKASPPLHIGYLTVMHFKLVGLTSTYRYFLREGDIERSQTGAKPWSGPRGH